jgi:antitoxin YefM
MYSTYRMKANELTSDFVKALKNNYQNRQIEIIVQDVEDETEYLLGTPANREHLLTSIKNIENHIGLVEMNLESI